MNIGLALSGGGMRGVAHLGVIKALEERQITSTHIAGSSAGAVVGALYAYGYDWKEILDFFKSVQLLNITKYALGKPGIIDAEKFYPEFKNYIKNLALYYFILIYNNIMLFFTWDYELTHFRLRWEVILSLILSQ